jgi:hypothetical protein
MPELEIISLEVTGMFIYYSPAIKYTMRVNQHRGFAVLACERYGGVLVFQLVNSIRS